MQLQHTQQRTSAIDGPEVVIPVNNVVDAVRVRAEVPALNPTTGQHAFARPPNHGIAQAMPNGLAAPDVDAAEINLQPPPWPVNTASPDCAPFQRVA